MKLLIRRFVRVLFCFRRWETWETTHDGNYVWKVNKDCRSNGLEVRQNSCFLLTVMNMAAKRSVIQCTVCSHSYRNMHFTIPSRSSFPFPPYFSSISYLSSSSNLYFRYIFSLRFFLHFTYFTCFVCFLVSSYIGISLHFQILIPRQHAIYYLYQPQ